MATSKSQRLVNLVICLLSRPDFQSAQRIRQTVQGYEEATTDEGFARTFERDKAELEAAGVVLEKGTPRDSDEQVGYRIRRDDVELPPVELTPRAAGVLAVVGAVWAGAERNAEITGALGKLRAAGFDPEPMAPLAGHAVDLHEFEKAADLAEFAAAQRVVRFSHTAAGETTSRRRTIEPWLVASRAGRWYVVGYDRDRQDFRSFRVSRLSAFAAVGSTRATHPRPPIEQITARLDAAVSAFDATIAATVWVASGAGAELRAAAETARPADRDGRPGDLLEFSSISQSRLTRLVAGAGRHAVALTPPQLVRSVVATLHAAQEVAR